MLLQNFGSTCTTIDYQTQQYQKYFDNLIGCSCTSFGMPFRFPPHFRNLHWFLNEPHLEFILHYSYFNLFYFLFHFKYNMNYVFYFLCNNVYFYILLDHICSSSIPFVNITTIGVRSFKKIGTPLINFLIVMICLEIQKL